MIRRGRLLVALCALLAPVVALVAVAPAQSSTSYSAHVLALSPLGYWRLGESSGASSLVDSSGNAHPCSIVGSGSTLGVTGAVTNDPNTAWTLGGSAHGDCGNPASFQSANITLAFWYKGTTHSAYLVGKQNAYMLYCGAGGKLGFTNAIAATEVNTTATCDDNVWHFAAITMGASNVANNTTVYQDGVNVLTSQMWPSQNGAALWIGGCSVSNGCLWTGSVDEVALFPALTKTQLDDLRTTANNTDPDPTTTSTTAAPTTTTTVAPTTTTA